ncbi:Golgi phosphoprotein [Nesidiocoris tenuis]|uniref:Golgi phosphoprotein n=1 Tax=Nesidiocoris tenuis TaxID=355587 RepID=A0ABN7ARJ3_9HEMI|nr:Golgi phosphoprotein [Nesidiocoris tenuis]
MYVASGLQKRNVAKDKENPPTVEANDCSSSNEGAGEQSANDEGKLTLMEELLLLVMDPRGYVSVWNDQVSRAIRGSILIELWMRGKIELEPAGLNRKSLRQRIVIVKSTTTTEDTILNEALKIMKSSPPHSVPDWISYLSGESWNVLKLKYHMRNVRERLFKELVERGILSTVKIDYWLFDYCMHPVKDFGAIKRLRNKIKYALLDNFSNDLRRMDKRTLSLLILAQYSGGIEDCLSGLSSEQERLALRRSHDIEVSNFEMESRNGNDSELHWAVFAALTDPFVF